MKHKKAFEKYEKDSNLMLDYKVCCAHLGFNGSINRLAEKIMQSHFKPKYGADIHSAIMGIREKHNAMVEVRKLNFKESTSSIMQKHIKRNFDAIVDNIKKNGLGDYPIAMMKIIELDEK